MTDSRVTPNDAGDRPEDHRAFGRVADWLIAEGRYLDGTEALLEAFCRRLLDSGLPLVRASYVVQTLHPQDTVALYFWRPEEPGLREIRRPHGAQRNPVYMNSPIRLIFEGHGEVRRSLEGDAPLLDFPILTDLLEEGITDYIVLPVPFGDGKTNAFTFATRRPGGFDDSELDEIRDAVATLVPLLELQWLKTLSRVLLDTYLGHETGRQVLSGEIVRGSGRSIHAAIWYCDMRDFTGLSERQPADRVIAALNDYFEVMAGAVAEAGGEVLKFIGDAMLAIFPPRDGETEAETCARVLAAAVEATGDMAALNRRRGDIGQPAIGHGLALHIGDVHYGNIGAPARLDFTVIGAAVNLVSRIEGLSLALGRPLLVSADFAACSGGRYEALGEFSLKGIARPQAVFAPVGEKVE